MILPFIQRRILCSSTCSTSSSSLFPSSLRENIEISGRGSNWQNLFPLVSSSIFSFLSFFLSFFMAKTRNSIYRTLEKFRGRGKRRDEKFGRPITRSFIRAACQSPKSNERIFYLSREGRPT